MNNIPVELARRRKIRERNPVGYRLAHWLIWIWVCYITPGPLTFDLFARGFDLRMAAWLGVVLAATGVAGLRGRLPGVEARPYIIRFTEDKPNPVYRRVCYTLAWSDVVTFALLNLSSLIVTIMTGGWYLRSRSMAVKILGAAGCCRAPRQPGTTASLLLVNNIPVECPAHPVHSAWRACNQRLEYNPYEPLGAGQRPCGQ